MSVRRLAPPEVQPKSFAFSAENLIIIRFRCDLEHGLFTIASDQKSYGACAVAEALLHNEAMFQIVAGASVSGVLPIAAVGSGQFLLDVIEHPEEICDRAGPICQTCCYRSQLMKLNSFRRPPRVWHRHSTIRKTSPERLCTEPLREMTWPTAIRFFLDYFWLLVLAFGLCKRSS